MLADAGAVRRRRGRSAGRARCGRGSGWSTCASAVAGTGAVGRAAAASRDSAGRCSAVDLAATRRAAEADGRRSPIAGREALLRGAGLVAGPVEALADGGRRRRCAGCAELPVPVAARRRRRPGTRGGADAGPAARRRRRRSAADRADRRCGGGELGRRTARRSTRPRHRALRARARRRWPGPSGPPRPPALARRPACSAADDLRRGARAQNAAGLERLARRIEPAGRLGRPRAAAPPCAGQLHELAARARHRDQVLADWRMRPGGGRGRGVTALFAGDSGTGKTMSAEVIAGDLGLDLYTVNLATVVDKYVGETEKNLERIFAEAGGVNAVLLFDEADAIFGKRSEVRDAHDRYANIESAYLLQRMETFDGLAVLATNLRANIDEAFTRRLDAIVDFPAPDRGPAAGRCGDSCLGAAAARVADDLDLDFCAQSFELVRRQHPLGRRPPRRTWPPAGRRRSAWPS